VHIPDILTPRPEEPGGSGDSAIASLSQLWAKRYIQNLVRQDIYLEQVPKLGDRQEIAEMLMASLRPTIAQAWTATESLLAQEVIRHQIDFRLIDPWAVAKDAQKIYEKTLLGYAQELSPAKLSVLISRDIGTMRRKYTEVDPRVIGFVSMQVHHTGQMLLKLLPRNQHSALNNYFKVIDDHLYMPLQRAYNAAAQLDYHSPELQIIHRLLPASSEIARKITARVIELNPHYYCHSGVLSDPKVQISSLRDVEMFQVYLWVCVLENNVSAVQQELFPLCVMLYPTLKVRWELVRELIFLLGNEVKLLLTPNQLDYYMPYYKSLWLMFSPEVFPEQ
jgi:hypothetical protein